MKNYRDYSFLVSGVGSIGLRHIRNLRSLGVQRIAAVDTNSDRLESITDKMVIEVFTDYDQALKVFNPDVALICTPPVFHIRQAMLAVKENAHVFIEKPLSHTLEGVDELSELSRINQRVVSVGYNLRFHPGLRRVKDLLDRGVLGSILWIRAEYGQYLPDWRPWQNYKESYTARKDLGGGIILDMSHEIDYVIWLAGEPSEISCFSGHISNLEVDVEDTASMVLRLPNGIIGEIHVDFVQRTYNRTLKVVGELGSLELDLATHDLQVFNSGEGADSLSQIELGVNHPESIKPNVDIDNNDIYLQEIRSFLECIQRQRQPEMSLSAAKRVLEVALAAKRSSRERLVVSLPEE